MFLNVFQYDSGATYEMGAPEEVPPTERFWNPCADGSGKAA